MAGLKIVLGTTFTDPSLPTLQPDSLMSSGSIFLVDFGREETASLLSVPAHGGALVNLAWENAATLIGSGNEATLAGVFENTLVGQPTMGAVERSGKKGIAVISSQSANDTSNRHSGLALPSAIIQYIHANLPSHAFYFSVWGALTRVATATIDSTGYVGDVGNSANSAFVFYKQPAVLPGSGTPFVGGRSVPNSNIVGSYFRNIAVDEWSGAKPTVGNTMGRFWFGQYGVFSGFQRNQAASGILYRIFIEDLTASGRSYATVDAADKAMFDAAFGPGGRFEADTFTNPSTIP